MGIFSSDGIKYVANIVRITTWPSNERTKEIIFDYNSIRTVSKEKFWKKQFDESGGYQSQPLFTNERKKSLRMI